MANYSDDAKYVSAFNRGLAASNKAKLYLSDLNKAKPDTAQWKSLKAKYDEAKATADAAEAERIARKKEIDDADKKVSTDKKKAADTKSAKADLTQLEYQVQVAKNKGDAKAQAAAEAALKTAQDTAAGIVTPPKKPDDLGNTNPIMGYTINSNGSVVDADGPVYLTSTVVNGQTVVQPYNSIATARTAFLKNYAQPGQLDSLKKELLNKHYITSKQLSSNEWLVGVDTLITKYTYDAAVSVQYENAKEPIAMSAWMGSAKSGLPGAASTSKAGTWKDTSTDITTVGDAYKEINDYMLDVTGFEATQEQKDAYFKDINARELKSGVQTVSTRDATGKITKSTKTGAPVTADERLNAMNAVVSKALAGTDAEKILSSTKGSKISQDIAAIQAAAADYGQPMTAGQAMKYVLSGFGTPDYVKKQTERLRLNSMTMYSNLKDHIQNGGTVKDIADQYAVIKAKKLGIALTDSMADKDVQSAIGKDGGLMSTAEFTRQMQANPLWRQTNEAHETAADFANTILKSFGFMG
jgi:hypothetical protein